MGGYGSTRWGWHRRKLTVEECFKLDIGIVVKGQALRDGASGTCQWGQSKVGWKTQMRGPASFVFTLAYTLTRARGKEAFYLPIPIISTPMPRGGERYGFRCPLKGCKKPTVRKLYLPTGANYFGCRQCHGLVYSSSQESRKPSQFILALALSEGYSPKAVRKIWSQ